VQILAQYRNETVARMLGMPRRRVRDLIRERAAHVAQLPTDTRHVSLEQLIAITGLTVDALRDLDDVELEPGEAAPRRLSA